MIKKLALAVTIGALSLLAISGNARATDGYYWGIGDQSASGGGQSSRYNGWNWNGDVLAWFEYEFENPGTASTSPFVAQLDPTVSQIAGFGPSSPAIASVPGQCREYSTSFFLSGHVAFNDNTYSPTIPRNSGYWELANGLAYPASYTGLYLGLLSKTDTSVYVTQEGELTRAPKPAGIKRIRVVSPARVMAAWNDLVDKGLTTGPLGSKSAFCGGQLANKDYEGYYKGHSRIRVIASDIDGGHDVSADDTNKTLNLKGNNPTVTVRFRGYGYAEKDKSKTITSGYEEYSKTNFTLTTKMNGNNYSARLVNSGSTLDSYNSWPTPNNDDGSIVLSFGASATVCTNNRYNTHYKNGWTSEFGTAEACYTVTYTQNTKAQLGSVSAISVSGKSGSETVTKKAMDIEDASRGLSNLGTVFENEQVSVALNSNYPKSITEPVLFNPGNIAIRATNKITKEGVTGTDADVKLQNISIVNPTNSNNCGADAVLSKGSNYKDCYNSSNNVLLYPQESKTLVVSTTHPKEISSTTVTDGTTESSEASIAVKGDSIICKDFNNVKVGVENRQSFGRISFRGSTDPGNVAGDMPDGSWVGNATKWLKPNEKQIQLVYYGCDGNLIGLDYDGADTSNHQYTVSPGYSNGNTIVSGLYKTATSEVGAKTAGQSNIKAEELGATARERLDSGKMYQFVSATKDIKDGARDQNGNLTGCTLKGCIDLLGHSVDNTVSWTTNGNETKTATLTLKRPYNYYLETSLTDVQGVVFLGEPIELTASVTIKGRENAQINDNRATKTKTTTIATGIITLGEGVTQQQLSNINSNLSGIIGNKTDEVSMGTIVRDATAQFGTRQNVVEVENYSSVTGVYESNPAPISIKYEGTKERVGQKICAVIAVYPTDSHDTGDGSAINDDDQSAALSGEGPNAGSKTSIRITCSTVGKKPTMSVEGGDVVSNSTIKGATTKYNNHIFGSWAEYGLVSLNGPSTGFGSGASLMGAANSGEGLEDGNLMYPQSLGNYNSENYGLDGEDSGRYFEMSRVSVDSLRSAYIKNEVKMPNQERVNSLAEFRNLIAEGGMKEGTIYIVDYSKSEVAINKNVTISQNIENDTKTSIIVINTTGNINIERGVTRIDAILIAYDNINGRGGRIDTCSGQVAMFDGKRDQPAELDWGIYPGNQHLLQHCSTQLVINGSVFAKSISLDRVYGGGSNGENDNLDPNTLSERAEKFIFDPRIVLWAYKANADYLQTDAVYIKELTPRL